MFLEHAKRLLLPDGEREYRVLWGPFRGARLHTNARNNLRKILGLYEHELNDWLEQLIPRVETVLDVGANDGYFTLGCAAAFRRKRRRARIFAFEPQTVCCQQIRAAVNLKAAPAVSVSVEQTVVGNEESPGMTTLNAFLMRCSPAVEPRRALIKIDVEGAELMVVDGGSAWLHSSNYFLIEVHEERYVPLLQKRFADAGITLERRDQKPLLFLGREQRAEANCWLVSQVA